MSVLNELINTLSEAALHPAKTIVRSINDTGKEAVGCFPIYTPEEIIYAAGYLPVGMWGGQTEIKLADKYLQGFCCSIMRSNIEYGMRGTYNILKAIVLPTFCDTLKCICENWKVAVPQIPIIPIVYPQNRLLEAGAKYLKDEFERVKAELESISGKEISDKAIEEAFDIYEENRKVMREFTELSVDYLNTINAKVRHLIIKSGYFMDKKKHTEIIKNIINELKKCPKEDFKGIKAVATGLIAEPIGFLDLLVENNIAFVGDDLAHESRQFRTLSRNDGNAIEKMVYRIVDQRGCTFLYEEQKTRGQMIIDMVNKSHADMVISIMMKFCDPEEFDYPIYKKEIEEAEIPLLYIEIEQGMDSLEQIRTRIQSFVEMLS